MLGPTGSEQNLKNSRIMKANLKAVSPLAVLVTTARLFLFASPAAAQVPVAWEATQYFQYNIDGVVVGQDATTGSRMVSVVFSVTDPSLPGEPWNIKSDAPFTQSGSYSRLAIDIGWSTPTYSNIGAVS